MTDQWWSWVLTAVGLTGFILAGRKVWWCWYVNIACQALWYAYAIMTEQWGFLVAATAYTIVFTKNAISWTREHFDENEGWDFNEYTHLPLPEVLRDYSEKDVELTMRMHHRLPHKEHCEGGTSGPINPDCPLQNLNHIRHSWVVTYDTEEA